MTLVRGPPGSCAYWYAPSVQRLRNSTHFCYLYHPPSPSKRRCQTWSRTGSRRSSQTGWRRPRSCPSTIRANISTQSLTYTTRFSILRMVGELTRFSRTLSAASGAALGMAAAKPTTAKTTALKNCMVNLAEVKRLMCKYVMQWMSVRWLNQRHQFSCVTPSPFYT